MPILDVTALRPQRQDIELVAGLLAELGEATAAELVADVRLPLVVVGAALSSLERSGRACHHHADWTYIDTGPRPPRRSWLVGRDRSE